MSERLKSGGFTSLIIATSFLAMLVFVAHASGAPQGPWLLPASDISDAGQDADRPQVAALPDGSVAAVWTRFDGAHTIVQAAIRPLGGTFGEPDNLSDEGRNASNPQIVASPDGTVTVVWARSNGANTIIQASTRPAGGSFGEPDDLSLEGGNASEPQIAASEDGAVTVIWRRFNGSNTIIQAVSRPADGAFGEPDDVSLPGQSADQHQLAVASDGTATAVWRRSDGLNDIIQAATKTAGGEFGEPDNLSEAGESAFEPRVVASPDGTFTAVWSRPPDGSFNVVQSATRAPGGSFGEPVDLSETVDAYEPRLTASPDGTVTAVWTGDDGGEEIVQSSTRPPGGAFSEPVDLSETGQDSAQPQVVSSPDGTVTVVWQADLGADEIIESTFRPPAGSFGPAFDLSVPGDAARPQLTASLDGSISAVWVRTAGSDDLVQAASTVRPTPLVQVAKEGQGTGRVTSSPAGVDCGGDCAENFPSFTEVILTAVPEPGSTFAGWSADGCEGTATCRFTVLSGQAVTATFGKVPARVARIGALRIKGPSKVKRGKRARFRVAITNSGDAVAREVRVKVTGKGVSTTVRVGVIAAGKTRSIVAKVKPRKAGRIKLTFRVTSANAGKRNARRTIRVRRVTR